MARHWEMSKANDFFMCSFLPAVVRHKEAGRQAVEVEGTVQVSKVFVWLGRESYCDAELAGSYCWWTVCSSVLVHFYVMSCCSFEGNFYRDSIFSLSSQLCSRC